MARFNAELNVPQQVDENVLKTVQRLFLETGHAYANEVAESLNMPRPTLYGVIKRLAEAGDVYPLERRSGYQERQSVQLTPQGEQRARKFLERHETIKSWLTRLGVPEEEADDEACHMEHGLTDNTMDIVKRHVKMASEGAYGELPAEELMKLRQRQPAKMQGEKAETLTEQITRTIEALGGLEGAVRKGELVEQAGGEENLSALLQEVEALGGVDAARQELRAARELTERYGTLKGVKKQLDLMETLGSGEELEKLKAAVLLVGGVPPLLKLVNSSYRIWKQALERDDQG